jgi:DDE superfamily endonuclease
VINISNSGYTNDEIGVQWLKHFILHTKSSLNACKKLLIYNRHSSYDTDELKRLAAANNIFLLKLPLHLTHILQPLDVGVFQTYKHCHNLAVH